MAVASWGNPKLGKGTGGGGGGSQDPRPSPNVCYEHHYLMDGSNKSMDVDGSGTAVVFDYEPGTGEVRYLEDLILFGKDRGDGKGSGFFARSQLSNGLLIEFKCQGATTTIANLKHNDEIQINFPIHPFTMHNPSGKWQKDSIVYQGIQHFDVPVCFDGDQSDFIKATVRDNLNGLDELFILARVWKVAP